MALQTDPPVARRKTRRGFNLFADQTRDQKLFIAEATLVNSATVITGGAFLTGLLLMMGADDLLVGIVMSSGGWSLMLSLISSLVVERVRRKKAILAGVLLAFRLLTALPVFLPLFMGTGRHTALAAAVMMVAGNALFSIYNTGFPIFFMDSLPEGGRASYIYTRMLLIRIAYTVASVAMGLLMDLMNKSYAGFIIVFSLGIVLGVANSIVLLAIRGPDPAAARPSAAGLAKRMLEPFKNRRYLRFLVFIFAFFFFMAASSSFTSLYQYKYLGLSYGFITIYNTCTYLIMIFMTRRWEAIEARIGKLKVLVLSSLLVAAELLVYAFLTKQTLWIIALSPIIGGLGNSGLWACMLPYRYDLMPAEGKTVYEGWYGFVFGAAGLLGTLAGGLLQGALRPVPVGPMTFSVFQLVYLMSAVTALLSALAFWSRARRDEAR